MLLYTTFIPEALYAYNIWHQDLVIEFFLSLSFFFFFLASYVDQYFGHHFTMDHLQCTHSQLIKYGKVILNVKMHVSCIYLKKSKTQMTTAKTNKQTKNYKR